MKLNWSLDRWDRCRCPVAGGRLRWPTCAARPNHKVSRSSRPRQRPRRRRRPTAPTASPGPLRVYVSGAVVNPAVYTLPPGSIVDDAVRAAGGLSADADPVAINLAGPLADGMQIYVPARVEGAPTPPPVSAPVATADPGASRMGGVTIAGLIDINLATQADLEMLPGIGPTTAANIIAHREANGPFATIEAIMDVPGIGEGKFAAMKDLITVGP
ncbi:MAG: helix-hairpin-helix domain-containing protein [Candidatus Promineofilum sp.]|nr:helix-hairpin-helix domain-containing protein [Promineifilum sp.]